MRPISFKKDDGVIIFVYDQDELDDFHKRGKEHGDVGMILVKRNKNLLMYSGYGTIENPRTWVMELILSHFEPFNGPMPTDEERCQPPKERQYEIRIINLGLLP